MRDRLTIGIAGAGGDGVVALASFLQKITATQGYFSQLCRYYGAQIRGGASGVKLSLDIQTPSIPEDIPDIMLCFNWGKWLELRQELPFADDTLVVYEGSPPDGVTLPDKSLPLSFSEQSKQTTGIALNKNIVALGFLLSILALAEERVRESIDQDAELTLVRSNLKALEAGESLSRECMVPELSLSPARDISPKVILSGNVAMARAAVANGCRAYFGYPITPASEIMQEMQAQLSRGKGVFLQAEDEIASAGLAIGASLAGAKSLVSTSGPGFDLMTEMMNLACAAEIPLMIIDVQRAGPSTGIPSKSEQSDLNHAIYGGHGDAPRVVIAPYDLEGCYRLVIEGINIAQYFQTPVILLSDQWLGQSTVALNDDFLKRDYPSRERKSPTAKERQDYQRYRLTEDFISPMSAAGDEGFVYQTSGLTHSEKGTPAFDLETHQRLHEKRWQKLTPLGYRDELIKVFGREEASRGIISWGSSAQVVLEAVSDLELGNQVKVCVPELLHPLPQRISGFLRGTEKLLVVELNYSGQFYHYLRSQIDLPVKTVVYSRAGGSPFSRKELARAITEVVG